MTVTPASMWRSRIRRRASASTAASSARLLTPMFTPRSSATVGGDGVARLAQRGEDVAQVVLALRRCRWRGRPSASASGAGVEGVGAGVDLADRELLGVGVAGGFGLDDPLDLAVGVADDAPVGAGVVELDVSTVAAAPGVGVGVEQAGDRSRRRSAGGRRRGRATVSDSPISVSAARIAPPVPSGLAAGRRSRCPRGGRRRCRGRARRSPRPARRRPRARRGSARRPSAARRRDAASSAATSACACPRRPP